MKHVQGYYEYITEGKKQNTYTLKVGKDFNIFNLLNDLKPLGAEVLNNQPGKKKEEMIVTVAMDNSKKNAVEEVIAKVAEII